MFTRATLALRDQWARVFARWHIRLVAVAMLGLAPNAAIAAESGIRQVYVNDVLDKGVVIVVSTASQQMYVLQDGDVWRSSPVSTGKKGKETPTGVFAILQKRKVHRSNLYANAPMPFMQRLTWDGIAIHAGALPGYPASHGCIRLPKAFARELYSLTRFASTAVIVVDEAVSNEEEALAVAEAKEEVVPIAPHWLKRQQRRASEPPRTIARRTIEQRRPPEPSAPAPVTGALVAQAPAGQTIQLAAALSQEEADKRWQELVARKPELDAMEMRVIPAIVRGTQYYRVRASSPRAHATCRSLKRDGIDCFPVG